MGAASERHRRRLEAKKDLADLLAHANSTVIVHYSCESFYDRTDGSSPRITSIAVRNLSTGQTVSFSIHQIAEREQVPRDQIEAQYNTLERTMLDDFYKHVAEKKDSYWLHWNMRDINYGFPAIAHRYRVLGGTPVDIHESNLHDFARLLISLFSPTYAGHPRLTTLMQMNKISDKDFLVGAAEADAFMKKEYVKLHQSTLRKVDVIGNLFGRVTTGTLKTSARKVEIYGTTFAYCIEFMRDHYLFVLIGFVASVASIVSLILWFASGKK
jgi:hypothetical protein